MAEGLGVLGLQGLWAFWLRLRASGLGFVVKGRRFRASGLALTL